MSALEELKAVRELLSAPARWTRGVYARNEQGLAVDPHDPEAVCWCLYGAMIYIVGDSNKRFAVHLDAAEDAINVLSGFISAISVADWQDAPDRTHAEVLDALDRAIAVEEDVDG